MTAANDTPQTDTEMLENMMKATGLPREVVEGFLLSDSDLDALCDAVLSELAVPFKKITPPTA